MRVTFPHLGNAYIAVESLLRGLGHEPVTPPPTNHRTLERGSFHSPAELCLPFKIALGNMLDGLDQGADCVLMIGGWGPCRLGYYAEIQRLLLEAVGRDVEFITLEVPRGIYSRYWNHFRRLTSGARLGHVLRGARLAWAKLNAVEALENLALQTRPRETQHAMTTQFLKRQLDLVRRAASLKEVEDVLHSARQGFLQLRESGSGQGWPLRLGVVGEIYTVVEPLANLNLEERLGNLGVEVVRTISLAGWVTDHIFKKALGCDITAPLRRLAAGYLRGFVGGHGLETIARSAALAKERVDGIVHILPLSCMPEVVAKGILPAVSRDHQIPVLSLVVDEHTAECGFQTRLEAFVDLVQRRVGQRVGQKQACLPWS